MKYEKNGRKIKGYTYKITSTPAANYLILQNLAPIKKLRQSHLTKMINFTNYLI